MKETHVRQIASAITGVLREPQSGEARNKALAVAKELCEAFPVYPASACAGAAV